MVSAQCKNVVRAASSETQYSRMEFMREHCNSLTQFLREFPDDEACLGWLFGETVTRQMGNMLFAGSASASGLLGATRPLNPAGVGPAWLVGTPLYPTAGTIFHKSSTSLYVWF